METWGDGDGGDDAHRRWRQEGRNEGKSLPSFAVHPSIHSRCCSTNPAVECTSWKEEGEQAAVLAPRRMRKWWRGPLAFPRVFQTGSAAKRSTRLGAEPPRPRHTFVSGHYKMNCFENLLRVTYFMILIHGTTKNMFIDLHLSVHAGFQRVEKPEESQERMGKWRRNKQRNASGIRSSVEWRRRAANASYNIHAEP